MIISVLSMKMTKKFNQIKTNDQDTKKNNQMKKKLMKQKSQRKVFFIELMLS